MWFKKNKKDDEKIQKLEKLEKTLTETDTSLKEYKLECESLNKELVRLKRIVKYSRDEPTFNILNLNHYDAFFNQIHNVYLNIYIEKEEYEIGLKEFHFFIDNECVKNFRIENGLVYLDIEHHVHAADWNIYKYIIDYRRGTYVYSIEEETRMINS